MERTDGLRISRLVVDSPSSTLFSKEHRAQLWKDAGAARQPIRPPSSLLAWVRYGIQVGISMPSTWLIASPLCHERPPRYPMRADSRAIRPTLAGLERAEFVYPRCALACGSTGVDTAAGPRASGSRGPPCDSLLGSDCGVRVAGLLSAATLTSPLQLNLDGSARSL
jgi:hypothetical protein